MAMSLEELKAQNAAQDEEETKAVEVETEEEETELEAEEEQPEVEQESEEDDSEAEESELEAWQLEDEQASDDSGKRFTDSDVAAAKRKLKAKIEKRDDEIAQLRAEIESLKKGGSQPAKAEAKPMPKLEDYDYDDSKYQAAVNEWMLSQLQNVAKSQEAKESKTRAQQALESAVESHYERAAKLTAEHGIDDSVYHSADLAVRQAVESVFPDSGDVITDSLIANMGEGSEKVIYALGRSTEKREQLKAKLLKDPNGIAALIYLGELKAEITRPAKRVTNAPKPAARATGGSGGGSDEDRLRRKYQRESDLQSRFNIRREARQKGIDVSKW